MKDWLIARLKEPSTYRGLVWVLTACGVTLAPDVWEQITAVGMAISGLLGVALKDPLPPIQLVAVSQKEVNETPFAQPVSLYGNGMHNVDVQSSSDNQTKLGTQETSGWNG